MAQSLATSTREQVDSAIRETLLDYVLGWYDGDPARMERSLHPELAKRIVVPHGGTTGDRLENMSALRLVQLVQGIRAGGGNRSPERRSEVTILDRVENAASVRVDATTWIDYMHLAKWNGRWAIVNVLWAERPKPEAS